MSFPFSVFQDVRVSIIATSSSMNGIFFISRACFQVAKVLISALWCKDFAFFNAGGSPFRFPFLVCLQLLIAPHAMDGDGTVFICSA